MNGQLISIIYVQHVLHHILFFFISIELPASPTGYRDGLITHYCTHFYSILFSYCLMKVRTTTKDNKDYDDNGSSIA